jgi:hypothetical protein
MAPGQLACEAVVMTSEHSGADAQMGESRPPRWRDMLRRFPAIRQVFHALCTMDEGEDAGELLAFAARQEWMADLARRFESVARLDDTMAYEPEDDGLLDTLWQLYAASRVCDALLLAHQPAPADESVRELDEALGRKLPLFRPVPVGQITQFFAGIGCKPVTEAGFDPILHEIITCEPADDPGAPIQITGQAWPVLMIGELVFARAGVHVRAGHVHAVHGIADRSTLHWEYWRRHRTTCDGSFWWGSNSQWKTALRRDYITSRGHIYDYDAVFSSFHRLRRQRLADDDGVQQPLTAEQASFIKNRCQLLRLDDDPGFHYLYYGIDERHLNARVTTRVTPPDFEAMSKAAHEQLEAAGGKAAVVGKTAEEAEAWCREHGFPLVLVEGVVSNLSWSPARIRLIVNNGVVTDVHLG